MTPDEKLKLLNSLTDEEKRLVKACVDADSTGKHLPEMLTITSAKLEELGLLSAEQQQRQKEQHAYPPFVTDKAYELFE